MAILLSVLGLVFLLQRVGCERLVNIALNKTPTQNGTLRYPKAGGPFFWNVSNSVDGRTDCTTPDYQTYSGTFEVDNPWWQLDLGSIYSIHAIHVLGRLDANNQLTGFRLWTGLEGDNLSISYRNTISDYNHGSIWINTSMTARVIKIDLPKDAVPKRPEPGPVVLCEVEVYVLSNDIIKTTSNVSMTNDIYHNYGANYSIDGKYPSAQSETPEACNCCSVAGGSQIPWWTIDFRIPRKIGGICITGRRDSFHWPQSKDLMILISNTSLTPTLWQSSEPIWTISESSPGYFFQHTFQEPIYFRYMTITTLMRRVMTICEVDFITTGCQPGSYGDNCSENCGFCNDSTNTCLVTNGTCPSGCLSGYDYRKDKTCKTECSDGHYGANCQDNCGKCAVSSNCSHYDGTCPADCAPGYNHTADNKCNTECSDGRYGPNCQGKCGHCALGSDCAHNDGRCSDGCSPGYNFTADNRCTIACSDGHYGADCQNNCGNCALGSNCSHYDGTCSGGCDPGYNYTADNRCNTECSDGRFGPNCQDKCGNCHLASDCSHKNGRCSDGCAPGYNYTADNRCIIACSGGHYGADCQNNCGNCALGSNCSHYDGTCPTGCAPGYRYTADNKCKTECSNGFYGMNCTETCGHCHNTTCSVADGICPDGCAPGFEYSANATCKQENSPLDKCHPGQYGQNCEDTCGHCIDGNTTCSITDGSCLAGCASGYDYVIDMSCKTECQHGFYGLNCSETCGHCIHGATTCSVIDGTFPSGCKPGYNPADKTCKTGVNILRAPGFSRNTSQSSQYLDSDSSRAIDGFKGPDPETCKCCSQTQNAEVSWWQVDIGMVLPIGEIVLYGQNGNRLSLSGFSVYLSTSVSFPDVPFVKANDDVVNVTYHIDALGNNARYVRIQRNGVLIICEVEIFLSAKSCPPSTYTVYCIPCGHCYAGLPCDDITGRCPNGCETGYSGDTCNQALNTGTSYGTKDVVGAAIGGTIGGAIFILLIGMLVQRRNKLRCPWVCQSSQDYESPKPRENTDDQNMYDVLDIPELSDQSVSGSMQCMEEVTPATPHYQNTNI